MPALPGLKLDGEWVKNPLVWTEVIRQWSTFHPEFAFLPRKFKIAVCGTAKDRAATAIHDAAPNNTVYNWHLGDKAATDAAFAHLSAEPPHPSSSAPRGFVGRDVDAFVLSLLAKDPALTEVVRAVLNGQPCPTPESFYRLRSAGVITGNSMNDCRPRCDLYAAYQKRHLL